MRGEGWYSARFYDRSAHLSQPNGDPPSQLCPEVCLLGYSRTCQDAVTVNTRLGFIFTDPPMKAAIPDFQGDPLCIYFCCLFVVIYKIMIYCSITVEMTLLQDGTL